MSCFWLIGSFSGADRAQEKQFSQIGSFASIYCAFAVFVYNTSNCRIHIYTRHGAKSSILHCKPFQEHSYRCLAVPNIYTIRHSSHFTITMAKHGRKRNQIISFRTVVTQLQYHVEGLKNHR